jgi:hypothetical protein
VTKGSLGLGIACRDLEKVGLGLPTEFSFQIVGAGSWTASVWERTLKGTTPWRAVSHSWSCILPAFLERIPGRWQASREDRALKVTQPICSPHFNLSGSGLSFNKWRKLSKEP